MNFTFKTRKGNYSTVSFTHFIFSILVFLAAAVVVLISFASQKRYQNAFDKTYKAILAHEASITLKDSKAARDAVFRCVFSTPEIFTVDQYSHRVDGSEYIVNFTYNSYTKDYEKNLKDFNARLDKIVAQAPDFASGRETVKWIHDYIITHYRYGGEHSAYHMLTNGEGVCNAYTALFTALAERFGIEHGVANSKKMNHTWNMVKLDGVWYHLDVTWDDRGDEYEPYYEYYLQTSEEFEGKGHHDWNDNTSSIETYKAATNKLIYAGVFAFLLSILLSLLPVGYYYFFE